MTSEFKHNVTALGRWVLQPKCIVVTLIFSNLLGHLDSRLVDSTSPKLARNAKSYKNHVNHILYTGFNFFMGKNPMCSSYVIIFPNSVDFSAMHDLNVCETILFRD